MIVKIEDFIEDLTETERIELLHSAKTRDTFAAGAIKAVKFLKSKKNGLYTMRDVLGIK